MNLFMGDIYNRNTSLLPACRHLTLKLFIQSNQSVKVPNVADLKVPISPLLLVLETNRKSWAGNLSMWLDLTLDPSFMIKRG